MITAFAALLVVLYLVLLVGFFQLQHDYAELKAQLAALSSARAPRLVPVVRSEPKPAGGHVDAESRSACPECGAPSGHARDCKLKDQLQPNARRQWTGFARVKRSLENEIQRSN